MDDIDLELAREYRKLRNDPKARAKQQRTAAQSTYTRPVRSWCLVLRANDTRIDTHCDTEIIGHIDWDPDQALCAVLEVKLNAETVRQLCAPVHIAWPGVSIAEAARLFGVNPTTVRRWGRMDVKKMKRSQRQESPGFGERGEYVFRSEGRVVIDYFCKGNGRDLRRAEKRVWTRSAVQPAGVVDSGPWGSAIHDLTRRVPDDLEQTVHMTHRPLGTRMVYVGLLQCPKCTRWCYKLLWPQRIWTVADAVGAVGETVENATDEFVCWRCAGVVYESAERTSRPGQGRSVNVKGRFLRRALGVSHAGRKEKPNR